MPLIPPGFDVQGHRGARGLAPENTLPAFRRALDLGVTTLELDTVISEDGEVVVSHDPFVASAFCSHPDGRPVRPEDEAELLIYHMPYAEVARFDCGSRGHPRFPEQEPQPASKPTLRAVVRFAEAYARECGLPPTFYNVETKSKPEGDGRLHPPPAEFVRRLWEVVAAEGVAERFTLQSFDVRTLQEARTCRFPVRLALLVEETLLVEEAGQTPEERLREGLGALGFVPDIYSPDFRLVSEAVVEHAHRRGMLVIPWTVNEPDDMRRLRALGVDGLITDYPDRALSDS